MPEPANRPPNQDVKVQDTKSTTTTTTTTTSVMNSSDATNKSPITTSVTPATTNSNGQGKGAEQKQQQKQKPQQQGNSTSKTKITMKASPKGPQPPDGGWGWVVVLSSFMISVFVDGVCFSIGIFFNPIREHYKSSKSETAWVGSVLNGTYLSIGPIVGACVNRYGCRKMAMLGAVLATSSFFLSTFATTISELIISFGFFGGIGFGFVYLPAMVMVGYYFEKKRALATGIACCGSGIGSFVFAPVSNVLLGIYGWKGTVWIISAIVLNGLVFAIFYRPLEMTRTNKDPEAAAVESGGGEEEEEEGGGEEPSAEHPLLVVKAGENGSQFIKEVPLSLTSPDDPEASEKTNNKIVGTTTVAGDPSSGSSFIQDIDAEGNKIFPPRIVLPDICIEVTPAPCEQDEKMSLSATQLSSEANGIKPESLEMTIRDRDNGYTEKKKNENSHTDPKNVINADEALVKLRESLLPRTSGGNSSIPERPLSDILCFTTTITPHIRSESNSVDQMETFRSEMRLKKEEDKTVNPLARLAYSHDAFSQLRTRKPQARGHGHHQRHKEEHHHHSSHHHLDVAGPLMRKDIFYSGSLRNLPEYQSSESIDDYRQKVTMTMEVEEVETKEEGDEEEGRGGGGGDGKKKGRREEEEVMMGGRRKKGKERGIRGLMRRMVIGPLLTVFDISLLKSPTFCIYGLSCFLCMLGFFVPFIYLPTLCLDLGMGNTKAAFLISIIGIANTVGRVGVGFVSDQPWADCLLINNVALIIGGVCTCCVPFFTSHYGLFAGYSFVFGTSIAVFVSLRSIIMVELMGLQKLTNAFGLVIMFQGISTFIGAPIAGMISDVTGDYNISFYLAGLLMGLSGVICLPLRRIAFWENDRENKRAKEEEEEEEEEEEKEEEEKREKKAEEEKGEFNAQRRRLVTESSLGD